MAYAETQSMFCDSLLDDADWLALYARGASGSPMPEETIRAYLGADQPFQAFQERTILVVPFFERRLYALSDADLVPDRILELARACEREVLGVEVSPRPLLAIPHIAGEAACSYQGYLLARMAVCQTREHFLGKYGQLTDNPRIGEDLARSYWNPGNSLTHEETLQGLTGSPLDPRPLAAACNSGSEELWTRQKERMDEALRRPRAGGPGDPSLEAEIRVVHGSELIADNGSSLKAMCAGFEAWVLASRGVASSPATK
jgi:hypothetical protein